MSFRGSYLVLPSNASMDLYPENSAANYRIQLPTAIIAPVGTLEVGLTEIHFPSKCYTMDTRELQINMTRANGQRTAIQLPQNPFETVDAMVEEFNKQLTADTIPAGFEYQKLMNRMVVFLNYDATYISLEMSAKLASVLGLTPIGYKSETFILSTEIKKHNASAIGVRGVDLFDGLHSFYVYSDIVEPTMVGNTRSNILRVIPRPGSLPSSNAYHEVKTVHYRPFNGSHRKTLEVDIRLDNGSRPLFVPGKVSVVVHIRTVESNA